MAEVLVLPNIIWRIENVRSIRKKWSSTFTFLGEEWKLKFIRFDYSDGETFQIFLRKLTSLTEKHDVTLQASSNLLYPCGLEYTGLEECRNFNYFLSNEWCLWFSKKEEVSSCICYKSHVRFICSIRLLKGGETLYGNNDKIDLSSPQYSPCSYIMCQDFASLFNKKYLSDVTLVCGDQTIYAHRAILSARSKMFAATFFSQVEESEGRSLIIRKMEPNILKQLIRYIYSAEISELSVANVRKIYLAANRYKVESLKNKCLLMIENLNFNLPAAEVETAEAADIVAWIVAERAELAAIRTLLEAERVKVLEKSDDNTKEDVISYFYDIQAVLCSEEWKNLSKNHPKVAHEAFRHFVISSPCENPELV